MNTTRVSKKYTAGGIALAAVLVVVAVTLAIMLSHSPNHPAAPQVTSHSNAPAQGLVSSKQSTSAVLAADQSLISSSTISDMLQFRDHFLSKPLTIDPTFLQRALAGGLDGINGIKGGPLGDFQRGIISDGVITLNEYEQAESQYRSCLVAKGYSVAPLSLTGLGRYLPKEGIQLAQGLEQGEADEASCQAQYTGIVEIIWSNITAPLQAKVAQVQGTAMAKCLWAPGAPAAVGENAEQAKNTCMESIMKATDTFVYLAN